MRVWQGLLIFVAGAAAGSVASLFYLRSEFEKKVQEECGVREMAISDMQKKLSEQDRELKKSKMGIDAEVAEGISKALRYSEDDITAMIRKPRTGHSVASEGPSGRRKDVVFSVDENGDVEDYPREEADLEPISSEDFLVTRKEYDKITLTFYKGDGVLSNEDGDIVEDPIVLIGDRVFWEKEVGVCEENIAYIRNNRVSADYEIVCEDKSYTDDWAT